MHPTVIFDLDGTLTKRDTYIQFLAFCLKEVGLRTFSVVFLPFYALLHMCFIINNERLKEIFLKKMLSGMTLDELIPIIEKYINKLFIKGLNKPVVEKLNEHLMEGHKVILATASFNLYTLKLAEKFGIKHVVCTMAEVVDGVLTGRIIGRNCHGQEKVRRIEEILSQSELSSSMFYTDHHSDLPLLRKVKQGILVNPSLRTRCLTAKLNLPVLRLR